MAYVKKVKATIQLDKLILSCKSQVDYGFIDAIIYDYNEIERTYITFDKTTITRDKNFKSAYKYCYKISYSNTPIAKLEFCYKGELSEYIKFTVLNQTFYNGSLYLIPKVLQELHLDVANISELHIALDSYKKDSTQLLYSYIRNENYKLKVNGSYVPDMDKLVNDIVYYHKGSRRKPNDIKTINVKSKNEDKEFTTYDKKLEIETKSQKDYILDYHRRHKPDFKNIYRSEVKLHSDAIYRKNKTLEDKGLKKIELSDLFNKEFLYSLFVEYQNRIIMVRDRKNNEISIYPKPTLED